MKPGTFTHTTAVLLSSVTAFFTHSAPAAVPSSKVKLSKKSNGSKGENLLKIDPISYSPMANNDPPLTDPSARYPWKKEIVTTVFWIGEKPSANNPVPNRSSSLDANWTKNYGGFDDPGRSHLQESLDRDPEREQGRLRAMGRRRSLPHRSLAIRFRQRTSETEPEQG